MRFRTYSSSSNEQWIIEADDMAGACDQARADLEGGDWDTSDGTVYAEARVYELDADGNEGDSKIVHVAIGA